MIRRVPSAPAWALISDNKERQITVGYFDWDPFAAQTNPNMLMVQQDVSSMLGSLFEMIHCSDDKVRLVEIPTIVQATQRKQD